LIFPSRVNPNFTDKIGMGGDKEVGTCKTLPKSLPVSLLCIIKTIKREGLNYH
jgi:hypothetical protein